MSSPPIPLSIVSKPCADVYWFPLLSPTYAKEMIEVLHMLVLPAAKCTIVIVTHIIFFGFVFTGA